MSVDVERHLQQFRLEFDMILTDFLDVLDHRAEAAGPTTRLVHSIVKEFTLHGGKRLRPFLAHTSYSGYGGHDRGEILKASCALELMQSHLLIHDDLIDRAGLRRGSPSVHKVFERVYSASAVSDLPHLATSMAILAGNLAAAYGGLALSRSGFSPDQRVRALDLYHDIMVDENYGQVLDMHAGTRQKSDKDDILTVFYYKTTRYSIEGPLHLGAILAGVQESELGALSAFARPVGNIFQMQDDIQGLFSSEEVVGKPVGSDLKEGKRTLLLMNVLECASEDDKRLIMSRLGNRDITPEQLQRIREIIVSCGSLRYARELVASWLTESRSALQDCSLSLEARRVLSGLVEYLAAPGE